MATIALDIDPPDVIRLIEQYLKENNLFKTLQALQDETCVSLNTVDSIESFVRDINEGRWDVVLRIVKLLKLPDTKLIDLYEQIAIELIELKETRAANWLIHKTEPMLKLKATSSDRYSHLQNLLGRSSFDFKEAYRDGNTRERRRSAIGNALKKEVTVVPPQRLLSLIGDALKWQKHEGLLPSGSSIDIFTGKANMVPAEEETFPNVLHKHCVKPLKDGSIFVCCAEFSPDGHYLAVGYSEGLVEIRNSTTGRLANDLKFQAQKSYIVTPSKRAALTLGFSASEMLAVGDKSGDISIWRLETGQLLQHFPSVHHEGITCLLFHRNGKEILSGGHDKTVKLHGIRSSRTIRDFKGHKKFVKAIAFSRDDNYVVSGSNDSTVKIWNAKTAQLLHEYQSSSKVHTILSMPQFKKDDIFLIGNRTKCIELIDINGRLRASLSDNHQLELSLEKEAMNGDNADESEQSDKVDDATLQAFNAVCSSPKGNWIYAVDGNSIYCFNYSTKMVQRKLLAAEGKTNELIGVKHHPLLNLLATFDQHGSLKLWKP